jgi:hypothetical protein
LCSAIAAKSAEKGGSVTEARSQATSIETSKRAPRIAAMDLGRGERRPQVPRPSEAAPRRRRPR